ncbi:MAG: flagellar export protein FliJ [Myxococcota bacterium]|nr:flagellar export protein FliJ [Myxococcota bacterium]
MKKFRFRLAPALSARRTILEAIQGELAEVLSRQSLAEELLEQREQALKALAAITPKAGQPFDPGNELIRQRHLKQVRDEIERRQHQLSELNRVVDETRDKVAEAFRDVRALEILEEKDREHWKVETRRDEQKESDDFGAQRHGRSS